MPLINCGPTEIVIPRGTPIGHLETIFADGAYKVDEAAVEASLAQAGAKLVCEEEVFNTPNAQFRRVEVSVYPAQGERIRLSKLVGFATNQL